MLRYVLTASIISFGALGAGRSAAAPPSGERTRSIEDLLRAIDVIPPDRTSLERAFPSARVDLLAIARDTTQSDWTRLRAISFLSFYPEAATRTALVELASAPRIEVRRAAIYALGRTFGASDTSVVPLIAEAAVRDLDASTRAHAVRALRWVDGAEAAAALTRIQRTRPELASVVEATVQRRAERLAR